MGKKLRRFGPPGFSIDEQDARRAVLRSWRRSGSARRTAAAVPDISVTASNASARTPSSPTSTTTTTPASPASESPSIITNRPLEAPTGVRNAPFFSSHRSFHLQQPQHLTHSTSNEPAQVKMSASDSSDSSHTVDELATQHGQAQGTAGEMTPTAESVTSSSPASSTPVPIQFTAGEMTPTAESVTSSAPAPPTPVPVEFTADHAIIQVPAATFIKANANFVDNTTTTQTIANGVHGPGVQVDVNNNQVPAAAFINASANLFDNGAGAHIIMNGVHDPSVQAQLDSGPFFQAASQVATPPQAAPVHHVQAPPVAMPAQVPPAQHGQVPAAQDGLPVDAMATATWNPCLRMYTAHPDWHLIPGLDTPLLCNRDMLHRLRYLFDFMATNDGGRAFAERIGHNLRIGRATLANANDHVTHDEYQINVLDGVPVDHNIQAPQHGAISLTAGRQAIADKLENDRHWQHIFEIEVRLSEVSLERVKVARLATPLLADIYNHVPLSAERRDELQDLFGEFQDLRDEAIVLFRQATNILGWGAACAAMVQRHRNEMWDLWGGAPASAVAHLL